MNEGGGRHDCHGPRPVTLQAAKRIAPERLSNGIQSISAGTTVTVLPKFDRWVLALFLLPVIVFLLLEVVERLFRMLSWVASCVL